ncbi:MAG TPA: sigma-70 family RNA polymerase sigma factor [Thermoanaerobaculia bacterium]|nr:sigma-70 family RNA polymerase sigma factor [Thermoanaerobaculia bacterium]
MREISERLRTAGTHAVLARSDNGGATEFESIYASYAPLLRRIAVFKFGVPRGDADALVHDVFATYLANPANVRDLHPYLIGAICNASRQYLRRDASERALFCEDSTACGATPGDELVDGVIRTLVINSTLARLGASCQDTLRRFYLTGESAPAIAESRNTSANYILRLLHFCRKRARAIYAAMNEGS